jgi:hypothetical protein
MEKLCSKCHCEKDEQEYTASQLKSKYGWCRFCIRLQNTNYYKNNKEKIISKVLVYAQEHAEIVSIYQKEYHKNNDKLARLKRDRYFAKREEINAKTNEYQKARRKKDPAYKLRKYASRHIAFALKRSDSSKNGNSILQFIPYSFQELKVHLEKQFEPWMTWENYGKYDTKTWNDNDPTTWTWQLDHIIPQANLPYTSMNEENFQKCWALSNLRPLSAKQNIVEGRRK